MDRVSDRRKEKERDRSESKDHHHRDRDRDREHKHRRRSRPDGSPDTKRESVERDQDRDRDSLERESRDRARDREHKHRRRSRPDVSPDTKRESVERDQDRDSLERESHDRGRDREHKHRRRSRPDVSPDTKRESVERDRDRDRDSLEGESKARSSRKRKDHHEENEDGDRKRDQDRDRNSLERESKARSSRKRKDHHEENEDDDRKRNRRRFEEDREEKKVKVKEEEGLSDGEDGKARRREGRRFSDGVKEEDRGKERKFRDKVKEEEFGNPHEARREFGNGDRKNGVSEKALVQEPLSVASEVSMAPSSSSSLPTKVSSIITTENEGVSIIGSDEVHGKSSTDGTTTSTVDKSGTFSLDALAKAKKALQKQKEISEKLKKLNKITSSSSEKNLQVASGKDAHKAPLLGVGTPSAAPTQATLNPSRSPVGPGTSSVGGSGALPGLNSIPNIEAVKRAQELAAKMGYRQDPEFAPLINMFPGPSVVPEMAVAQRPSKTPVLRLDAQGREIDEHGNIINMPKLTNLSTLKVNINKQKKEAFQILRPELDADNQSLPHFDERMGINKTKLLRPKRMTFQFVEEGKWSKQAELTKIKNQFGEAQSKELKVKQSQLAKAKSEQDDNPNFIAIGERVFKEKKKDVIPEIEWWDKPLLSSGTYTDDSELKLNVDKITIYVEHPRPIEPPAEPAPPPPQPLKLTKKEQKKLRTQRRLAKEKDRQEMIRQGLLEPPKAKIKMSNLMKVLGSEATQDPTRLEMEIRSAAAEREQAHVDRNIARKLTPAERREKKEKKLFEDSTTLETLVSVYKIKDLSHPQTRFKVDVNAQENRLTGCTVISEGISVVVVEGGKKSIKRYGKLMLKRINWAAAVSTEEDGAENAEAPINSCVLVWQGSVAKPNFNRFLVHQCRSDAAARKVFADAGVPHYWDLAVNFSDEL